MDLFTAGPDLVIQPAQTVAIQPATWYDKLTPGVVGGIASALGSMGKTMMHPGNPIQGLADFAIKYGPGMAQKEMLDKLISALKESRPATTTLSPTSSRVSPLAPAGASTSLETPFFTRMFLGRGGD